MKNFCYIVIILVISFSTACKGTGISWIDKWYVKDDNEEMTDDSGENQSFDAAANTKLQDIDLIGFKYKNWSLPQKEWKLWKEKSMPVLKQIHDEMSDEYIIEVIGHADSSGPEEPTGMKPGNLKISNKRADVVYNELIKSDFSTDKLQKRGAGSSELNDIFSGRDAEQRRVTFKVVKK